MSTNYFCLINRCTANCSTTTVFCDNKHSHFVFASRLNIQLVNKNWIFYLLPCCISTNGDKVDAKSVFFCFISFSQLNYCCCHYPFACLSNHNFSQCTLSKWVTTIVPLKENIKLTVDYCKIIIKRSLYSH